MTLSRLRLRQWQACIYRFGIDKESCETSCSVSAMLACAPEKSAFAFESSNLRDILAHALTGSEAWYLILSNRGSDNAGARIGRRIMLGLVALSSAEAPRTGARN